MPGKRISMDLRERVVKYHGKGLGYRKIADKLNMKKVTVEKLLQKFKKYGTVKDLPHKGRSRCTTKLMERRIISKIESNPRLSAQQIREDMRVECGLRVSTQTIRNRIHESGFKGRSARKKPFLSKKNIARRFQWAKNHENWTIQDWKRVIWSDETKINLFGSDGVNKVWRKSGQADKTKNCTPTVKHGGGSRMVWA